MSRLEEIKKRCEAATPEPWRTSPCSNGGAILVRGADGPVNSRHPQSHLQIAPKRDAAFIAHARQDIPFLLAEIERRDKAMTAAFDGWLDKCDVEGKETDCEHCTEHDSLCYRYYVLERILANKKVENG